MKPSDLIKKEILSTVSNWLDEYGETNSIPKNLDTPEDIENTIELLKNSDYWYDAKNEIRSATHETGLDLGYSRHYESKGVAMQIDGKWIGWTYWYGGGKHGEPSAIEWIDDAIFLDAKEETKVVMVFSKQNAQEIKNE